MATEPRAEEGRERPWEAVACALVVGVGAFVWAPFLTLWFAGEDYTILGRLRDGEAGSPHVFRPLADLWLGTLHRLASVDSAFPYHAAQLALHLSNALCVLVLARLLLRSTAAGLAAALVFACGAGVADGVVWVSAINRPLASFGGLVALVGVVQLDRWLERGSTVRGLLVPLVLLLCGLVVEGGANEEVYGTAGAAVVWLVVAARRAPRALRPVALLPVALVVALLALHWFVLSRVPEDGALAGGASAVLASAVERSRALGVGFGLPVALAPWLAPACFAFAFAFGRRRVAAFCGLVWVASFVPFALSDAVGYRAYPTQAPTALLVVAACAALPGRPRTVALAAVAVAAPLASSAARADALRGWNEAVRELAACAPHARAIAASNPRRCPVLVNLETSTAGLFLYHYPGETVETLRSSSFLDARRGFVPPERELKGRWFGRRCEGSYGMLDLERYFSSRPALPPIVAVTDALPVGSLGEAWSHLRTGDLDLARSVIVEATAEELAALPADPRRGSEAEVTVEQARIIDPGLLSTRMTVRVRAPTEVLVVFQEPWMYHGAFRFSPDQMRFSGVAKRRVVRAEAWLLRPARRDLPTFWANALGTAVLVPRGDHLVKLRWSRMSPEELRTP